jgi:hypothetical protein
MFSPQVPKDAMRYPGGLSRLCDVAPSFLLRAFVVSSFSFFLKPHPPPPEKSESGVAFPILCSSVKFAVGPDLSGWLIIFPYLFLSSCSWRLRGELLFFFLV